MNSYSSLSVSGDTKGLLETSSRNKRVTQENESAGRAKCEVTLCLQPLRVHAFLVSCSRGSVGSGARLPG